MKDIINYTENDNQFYPTPESFLETICKDFFSEIKSFHKNYQYDIKVLEPSAGKGNIADYLKEHWGQYSFQKTPRVDVECIEIDTDLRAILKQKGFPVVFDDFLLFNTYTKYDLIFMNPPFKDGEKHLLKAINLQEKAGGKIISILNAETLKNPCNRSRTELAKKLTHYNAKVKFYENAFLSEDSERKTSVETAVVWVDVPTPESVFDSKVFEELDRAQKITIDEEQQQNEEQRFLMGMGLDWIDSYISEYKEQLDAGMTFLKEYTAFTAKYHARYAETAGDKWTYTPPFTLEIYGAKGNGINNYVETTRKLYWRKLFDNPRFTGRLTSRLKNDLESRLETFRKYEFNEKNILLLLKENMRAAAQGVEEEILSLFDKFTQYAQYDGCENVHYYNGWKTNSAHRLNNKIIIPFYGVWEQEVNYKFHGTGFGGYCTKSGYTYRLNFQTAYHTLSDMSKTLNYLATGVCGLESMENVERILHKNFSAGNAKNIETEHLIVTFYKKGTCHIKFKNQDLLDKFNIFASQRKGWLPPDYGKTAYDDMSDESKTVIDAFQGKEKYDKIFKNSTKFIVETHDILQLTGEGA